MIEYYLKIGFLIDKNFLIEFFQFDKILLKKKFIIFIIKLNIIH